MEALGKLGWERPITGHTLPVIFKSHQMWTWRKSMQRGTHWEIAQKGHAGLFVCISGANNTFLSVPSFCHTCVRTGRTKWIIIAPSSLYRNWLRMKAVRILRGAHNITWTDWDEDFDGNPKGKMSHVDCAQIRPSPLHKNGVPTLVQNLLFEKSLKCTPPGPTMMLTSASFKSIAMNRRAKACSRLLYSSLCLNCSKGSLPSKASQGFRN